MNHALIRAITVLAVSVPCATVQAYELRGDAESYTTGAAHGTGGSLAGPSPSETSSTMPIVVSTSSSVHSQVQGAGTAYVDLGVIKLMVTGSTSGSSDASGTDTGRVNVDASGSWTDAITYSAAGYSGNGTAHARVWIDMPSANFVQATASGVGHYNSVGLATIWMGDSNTAQAFERECSANSNCLGDNGSTYYLNNTEVGSLAGYQDIDIPVVFGGTQSFTLRGDVYLSLDGGSVGGTGSYQSAGLVDLSHSIYWAGITSITAANGAVITNFSAIGSSGHDWGQSSVPSVPEPATYALLLCGLATLAWRRRR